MSLDEPVPLRVTVASANGTVTLVVTGDVDFASADELAGRMTAILADDAVRRLVVDFAGVGFLDSSGIAALVSAYRAAQIRRAGFRVVNCPPRCLRVLQITGLDELLTG